VVGFCWKFTALCSSESFCKSVKNWQSYSHGKGGTLFDSRCRSNSVRMSNFMCFGTGCAGYLLASFSSEHTNYINYKRIMVWSSVCKVLYMAHIYKFMVWEYVETSEYNHDAHIDCRDAFRTFISTRIS